MMNIKKQLNAGGVVLGGWLQISHPSAAEAMRNSGMDFLTVDAEHGDFDLTTITNTLRGMGDVPGFVRVRENDTLAIRQALDCGAQGVIVPLVETVQDARRAVAAAKYPPVGVRGFAFCRANEWGVKFDEYVKNANDNVSVIVMIESGRAVDAIEEIVAVEGVDGVLIGPYDLSGSLGVTGQTNHLKVQEAKNKVCAACLRYGKAPGLHVVTDVENGAADAMRAGFRFIVLGMDTVYIADCAASAVETVRGMVKNG